jgi:hypothetical protein
MGSIQMNNAVAYQEGKAVFAQYKVAIPNFGIFNVCRDWWYAAHGSRISAPRLA